MLCPHWLEVMSGRGKGVGSFQFILFFFFPQQAFIIYLSPVASLVLPAVDRAKSTIVSVFEELGVWCGR